MFYGRKDIVRFSLGCGLLPPAWAVRSSSGRRPMLPSSWGGTPDPAQSPIATGCSPGLLLDCRSWYSSREADCHRTLEHVIY